MAPVERGEAQLVLGGISTRQVCLLQLKSPSQVEKVRRILAKVALTDMSAAAMSVSLVVVLE
jgi:hypothetical protein